MPCRASSDTDVLSLDEAFKLGMAGARSVIGLLRRVKRYSLYVHVKPHTPIRLP